MRLFTLDKRLSLCAEFVRKGSRIADIGTDHAYLPVWLLLNGKIKSAIACDINEKPLKSGELTVKRHNLSEKIALRLSDGLCAVDEDEADDIVIAGMGGELIVKILEACPWAKNSEKRFILQPMTKCEVVLRYLYENGYEILSQKACQADKKFYTVILAQYTSSCKHCDLFDCIVGSLDINDSISKQYLAHNLSHLKNRALNDKSLLKTCEKLKKVCEQQ